MKIDPCRYCGGELHIQHNDLEGVFATCTDCKIVTDFYISVEELLDFINTRHTPEPEMPDLIISSIKLNGDTPYLNRACPPNCKGIAKPKPVEENNDGCR